MQGQSHAGLIVTSDASLPRSRGTIGKYVSLRDDLLARHPGNAELIDRVHWL